MKFMMNAILYKFILKLNKQIQYFIGKSIFMNIKDQYSAIFHPSPYVIAEYRTPQQYLDPGKIAEERRRVKNKKSQSQRKFKPSKRTKQFFIDGLIKSVKEYPSPCKYNTTLNLLQTKNKKNQIIELKPNAIKNSYIDQIQIKQMKQKTPGIGKYNLLSLTDFRTNTTGKLKLRQNSQKEPYFDSVKLWSSQTPGPGQHNPHHIQKKVTPNTSTHKFYQQKHKKLQIKLKRSQSAKLGPTSYNPVHLNTFDSLKSQPRTNPTAKWNQCKVQIRKGLRSAFKHPSSAQYQLINQWTPSQTSSWIKKSDRPIGKVDLFYKTVRSARAPSVYRD